jgi:hypothetical protein
LRHTGEEVKDKNENRLTRARTREEKMEEKFKWQPLALPLVHFEVTAGEFGIFSPLSTQQSQHCSYIRRRNIISLCT